MKIIACSIVTLLLVVACVPPYSPTGEKDPAAPQVATVTPSDGAASVPPGTVVSVTFTVAIDATTLTPYSLRLKGEDGHAVTGALTLSDDGLTASLVPTVPLSEGKTYSVEVTRQIRDDNGIPLDIDGTDSLFISTFSILATPPTVVSVTPADEATVAPDLTAIAVTFSEAMDPATITPATFLLSDMQGTISYDPKTLTARFDIEGPLTPKRDYTIFIAGTVTDAAGIPMGEEIIVRFTTTEE
ncbi:MAG TPA: Ig-like domain-containing protein [bacterium]|nr:Ig-like domain-containing protein [bacterium]